MQLATATPGIALHTPVAITPKAGDDKLKKACQQLEGVFFQMMLKEMRKTIPKSDLLPDDQNQNDIFQSMMDDHTAQTMADKDTSDSGMGAMLYAQLSGKKTYAAQAASSRKLTMMPVAATDTVSAAATTAEQAAGASEATERKAIR